MDHLLLDYSLCVAIHTSELLRQLPVLPLLQSTLWLLQPAIVGSVGVVLQAQLSCWQHASVDLQSLFRSELLRHAPFDTECGDSALVLAAVAAVPRVVLLYDRPPTSASDARATGPAAPRCPYGGPAHCPLQSFRHRGRAASQSAQPYRHQPAVWWCPRSLPPAHRQRQSAPLTCQSPDRASSRTSSFQTFRGAQARPAVR